MGGAVTDAWIYSAVRTPVGRHGGALADVRPDDLAAVVLKAAVERVGYDPARLDDVILGCANQAGEDNRNVARMAGLLAGFPVEVPGQTINRLCGSGLQAVASAAQAIKANEGDAFAAGTPVVVRASTPEQIKTALARPEVASVLVYGQIESDNTTGAAAVSVLLLAVSFAVLMGISFIARRGHVK